MYGYCKLTFWYTFVTVEEMHGTSQILFKIGKYILDDRSQLLQNFVC